MTKRQSMLSARFDKLLELEGVKVYQAIPELSSKITFEEFMRISKSLRDVYVTNIDVAPIGHNA